MNAEVWKENSFANKDTETLLNYIETVSAGHPDPLSAYLPYISDYKTTLLEPVLQKFINSKQYYDDSRYIRLWVIFADTVQRPDEVYNYLLQRTIGKKSSILYVALADVYEGLSWYELAELAYLKGILHKSEPFDKIGKCYNDFLNRKKGLHSKNQSITIEEIRALPHLRRLIENENNSSLSSPYCTPVTTKACSRINMSAYKNTPELENLYHSPFDSKILPHTPELVNGRHPLRMI